MICRAGLRMQIASHNSSITIRKMAAGQINCNDNCMNVFMLSSMVRMEQTTFQFTSVREF